MRVAAAGTQCNADAVLRRLWPLLFVCACSPEVAQSSRAIIGGLRDSGDPAVVLLVSYPPDESTHFTCTASLIAPTVLLTAAHCVDAAHHLGYRFGAFPGDDASSYSFTPALVSALLPVSAVHLHPAYNPAPPFEADIAVVELTAPLAVTPLPFSRQVPLAGQAARIVGYGQITYSSFNAAKYQAATVVQSLSGKDTVVVGDAQHRTCVGDSGGPALVKENGVETVIGVDSYTDTAGCVEPAHYRRTDLYTAFLDPFLPPPASDLPVPDDRAASPDRPGTVDQGTPPALDAPPGDAGDGCQVGSGRAPPSPLSLSVMALSLLAPLCRVTRARKVRRGTMISLMVLALLSACETGEILTDAGAVDAHFARNDVAIPDRGHDTKDMEEVDSRAPCTLAMCRMNDAGTRACCYGDETSPPPPYKVCCTGSISAAELCAFNPATKQYVTFCDYCIPDGWVPAYSPTGTCP